MKTFNFFLLIGFCAILSSCSAPFFYCTVSGLGNPPAQSTYYIVPEDSTLNDDLEFKEYASILKTRLNEVGYTESSQSNAALCIVLSYYMGEEKYIGTSSSGGAINYGFTNGTIKNKTTSQGSGNTNTTLSHKSINTQTQAMAQSSSNSKINQTATNYTSYSESSTAKYETPIGCAITALDNQNMKPIWKVEVSDKMRVASRTLFRAVMPWMIYAAQQYFGRSDASTVKVLKIEGEKVGLKWPYNSIY